MEKRVLIVDLNHIAHTYFFSQHRLSITVPDGKGGSVTKDTTIQSGIIKNIFNWSKGGFYPTAICMDRPVPARKAYFSESFSDMELGTGNEYKGDRAKMAPEMFEALGDVERIFRGAGVSVFAENGYEADDLIFACIKNAKKKYPGTPIDVITNDADLLPLVDDTVSVFLRSKKGTYAESKEIEKLHYMQVTPRNYESAVGSLSYYKGFNIPYNSILLHKLVRGDISDKFGRKDISRVFSPKKWNAFIESLEENNIDFESVFRYGEPQYSIRYKDTNEEFQGTLEDAKVSPDKANLYQKIENPVELDSILDILSRYSPLTEEQLEAVKCVYWGMNLNQVYPNKNPMYRRRAYVCGEKGTPEVKPFGEVELQKLASSLEIHLIR